MNIITEDDVIRFLEDVAHVFKELGHPVIRSFPEISETNGVSAILNDIAEGGNVQFNLHDQGIRHCYRKGWIHRTALDGCDVAVLPSRLHEK